MDHMQFETDLCVQLGPIPAPVCFPCVYAPCVSPTSPSAGDHYSDLDTPPPPNEDDHSEDRLPSMTVAPPVHYFSYLSSLHTRFWGMCFFLSDMCLGLRSLDQLPKTRQARGPQKAH